MRLQTGDKIPAFFYDTAFQSGLSIADTLKKVKGKTALVFCATGDAESASMT